MFDEDGSNANRTTGPAVRDQNLFHAILGLGKALVALDWQYFGIQSFLIFLSPSWKGGKRISVPHLSTEVFVVFCENCSMYVSIGDRGRAGIYTIIICTNRNKEEHYGYHTQLDKKRKKKKKRHQK